MQKILPTLFTTGALVAAMPALAAPLVDGSRDVDYGTALATQTVQTQFGDNGDISGFGDGGELDAGYAVIDSGRLYIMLTGNIQPNFNKVSVFIDSTPGGENTLDGALAYDFGDVSQNFGGLTFDSGFTADYHVYGRWGGGAFEVDVVDRANSTAGAELGNSGVATVGVGTGVQSGTVSAGGAATTGADGGTFLTQDVDFGFNNTNIAGVAGGTDAADMTAANAVMTGFEFSIALADIGNPDIGDVINIHAVYGNGDNNFHSNQVLGGLPTGLMNGGGAGTGTGNLGGDGDGNFTGGLAGIDFSQIAGNQFFSITVVPEPGSLALLGLGGLALLRRRR